MHTAPTHSNGGYWMILGLVLLLAAPLAVGHFTMKPEPVAIVHADASITQ